VFDVTVKFAAVSMLHIVVVIIIIIIIIMSGRNYCSAFLLKYGRQNIKFSHYHNHLCEIIFYAKFVDMLTAYLHTILYVRSSSLSLFIVIKTIAKDIFLAATVSLTYIRHKY
jgi:hypothetical protein